MSYYEPPVPDTLTPRQPGSRPPLWRVWFGLHDEVPRKVYAVSGFLLMLFKYCVETLAVFYWADHLLSPWEFLTPLLNNRVAILALAPAWLGWAMLIWTLPFIWIAFSMSVRRSANAGSSPWLGVLILVPLLNLVVMLVLAVAPTHRVTKWAMAPAPPPAPRGSFQAPARALLATLASLSLGLVSLVLGIYVWGEYGVTLFFGAPVLMGCVNGFIYNCHHGQSWLSTVGVSLLMVLAMGGCLLAFALEGMICILMAAPLVMPLVVFGALLGKAVACATQTTMPQTVGMLLVLPVMAGVEIVEPPEAPEYVVTSTVEIDASPETVWNYVVEFPDLAEPEDWFFRLGIACPMRARIEGHGVGAIRYCEFTTGSFVEPITTWDQPRHLAFDVTSQPDPMRELSPYRHVHPPHLGDQLLKSRRGEFRLVPLPGGRTLLEGRTWYTFEMYPQVYWTLWSDLSIQKIHDRVLDHIKELAEADSLR